jgi:hypothetical protein
LAGAAPAFDRNLCLRSASGGVMSNGSDMWLTPAQALCFLVTGDDIGEVAHLSDEVALVRVSRSASVYAPLPPEAGPEEGAAALKEIRERLATASERAYVAPEKWRDHLLATGLVAAEGRRTPSSIFQIIRPIEFCDLRLVAQELKNTRGDIVFYHVRMSGLDLSRARQRAVMSPDSGSQTSEARHSTHPLRRDRAEATPTNVADQRRASNRPGSAPPITDKLLTPASDASKRRAAKGRRGRKKGSGSIDDTEKLRAMLHLLASREAASVYDAARKVAQASVGPRQSQTADVSRLRGKFAEAYGTTPPCGKSWADYAAELNPN